MAAVFVQELGGTSGAAAPATYPVTLPNPTVAGNLIVIVVVSDATVATPAGFTLDKSQVNSNGHYHWSKIAAGGEAAWTVTPGVSAAGVWYAAEISGLTATPTDQVASTGSSSGATTRSTGTTGTTAQANELAVASWGSSIVGAAITWGGETNGFAERITDQVTTTGGSNVGLAVASLTLAATGTVESTATADAAEAPKSTGIVVTYKVAGTTVTADATLAATGTITAAAAVIRPAAATLTATGAVTATAALIAAADATRITTASITATAALIAVSDAAVTAAATITASAEVLAPSGALPFDAAAIFAAAADHAYASGLFDRVTGHEPKSAPGSGLTAAFWLADLRPVPAESGLSLTTYRLVLSIRIYNPMLQEPQDGIDPAILTATGALVIAYSGDFTLGGLVKSVDLLGRAGEPLAGRAGYIEQDKRLYRAVVITLPLILNDLAEQAP